MIIYRIPDAEVIESNEKVVFKFEPQVGEGAMVSEGNIELNRHQVDGMIANGNSGILICSTTGNGNSWQFYKQ